MRSEKERNEDYKVDVVTVGFINLRPIPREFQQTICHELATG